MSKKKKGAVPRLRFPEFRNAGPWEVKRLGDVVSITGGGTPSRSRKDFWNGNIPWVSSSDVADESIHELKITRWITSEAVSNSATKIVPENSILLVSRVGVGKVAISRTPVCTSQDFTNLTPIKDDVLFLGYYLSAWANVLKSFGQGMAILGFTKQDIENLAIPLPDANSGEQQKIADCLSSLDEVIELEAKRLDALKAHKKGLLQQLFPREGETTPRLRFPEFRDAGPWEVKRLGEVYRLIPTRSFSRDRLTYDSGTVRNIHYGDIHTKYHALFDIRRERVPFIIGLENEFEADCYCVRGDIIFADASEDLADIGKAIEIVNVDSEKVVAGLHTLHARQMANHLVVGFGGYLFQADAIRDQIRQQAQGAKVLGISASSLKRVRLLLPEKEEQQKIADCLSSLDKLIELETKKLEALKEYKKGLMQQLFPTMEENA